MAAIDLPPGMGLRGTALAMFRSPLGARWLARVSVIAVVVLGGTTWAFVTRHPYHRHASAQVVLPVAFFMVSALGFIVRSAKLEITRDGVRWGWASLSFSQTAAHWKCAHVWRDGITLQRTRGGSWFLGRRDWDRFEALVRQLRRTELPFEDHVERAPLRARMQSYGKFLDGMLVGAIVAAFGVMLWAA
jgi:hypothetical protein